MKKLILLSIVALSIVACGRYGPPRPPDDFAPRAVSNISFQGKSDGIVLSWRSPATDVRGRDLKWIDGYRILRHTEEKDSELLRSEFEEVAFIPDTSLLEREEARRLARERGEISRKIEVPADKRLFNFKDSGVEPGKVYLYQIVPVNQRSQKGVVREYLRVSFKGAESEGQLYAFGREQEIIPAPSFEEAERPIFSFGG